MQREPQDVSAGIVSVGVYLPKQYLTAAEVARKAGIPEEIIKTKMGWKGKYVPGPDDHCVPMGVWAAQDALSQTDIRPDDIDAILCTQDEYRDYLLQLAGPKLAYELGAHRAWSVDLSQRCGSMIGALKIAKDMIIADNDINTVLIAGGYRNGDLIDYGNPRTRFLIGLGAGGGAFLVRRDYPRNHILGSAMIVDGSFADDVIVPAGGTRMPITKEALDKRLHYADIADPEDMRERLNVVTLNNFSKVIRDALSRSGCSEEDLGFLALVHMKRSFHDHMLREFGLRDDQSIYLEDYAHTGHMDMPILMKLGLQSGCINDGTVIALVSAGIGWTWGATVVRWGQPAARKGV
jgi:3-oxoacyl-[acyl-carrier-protein] synthase-3